MWSFVIALAHFISETFIYKTAKISPGIISPLIVACECFAATPLDQDLMRLTFFSAFFPVSPISASSLTAMYLHYGAYVR